MVRVMFVCLGNICRSPTAHGVFELVVRQAGLEHLIEVASSGTSAYHIGESPDARSMTAAQDRGYRLSHLRAQQVQIEDFEHYDYLLAMDIQNLTVLQQQCPLITHDKVKLFLDFGSVGENEVPDPYYGGGQGFDHVLDLVEDASRGLLTHIRSQL